MPTSLGDWQRRDDSVSSLVSQRDTIPLSPLQVSGKEGDDEEEKSDDEVEEGILLREVNGALEDFRFSLVPASEPLSAADEEGSGPIAAFSFNEGTVSTPQPQRGKRADGRSAVQFEEKMRSSVAEDAVLYGLSNIERRMELLERRYHEKVNAVIFSVVVVVLLFLFGDSLLSYSTGSSASDIMNKFVPASQTTSFLDHSLELLSVGGKTAKGLMFSASNYFFSHPFKTILYLLLCVIGYLVFTENLIRRQAIVFSTAFLVFLGYRYTRYKVGHHFFLTFERVFSNISL